MHRHLRSSSVSKMLEKSPYNHYSISVFKNQTKQTKKLTERVMYNIMLQHRTIYCLKPLNIALCFCHEHAICPCEYKLMFPEDLKYFAFFLSKKLQNFEKLYF